MWLDSITEWINDLIDGMQEGGLFLILLGLIILSLLIFLGFKIYCWLF